ncbi:MAG: hypothetical protein KJZ84_17225 [Bryobacteraceae bacterium]|nr:hypothetical protein [Bryobacteraceae bacterium]
MKPWMLWTLAVAVTLASAVYQRLTGPTHPLRGEREVGGETVKFRLVRSHGGAGGAEVSVPAGAGIDGTLVWRRFKTRDEWTRTPMERRGERLAGVLPHQPPAGKLEYRVVLEKGAERVWLTGAPVVIRFRGHVPDAVLVVHVILMFAAMLWSNRAGLGALVGQQALWGVSLAALVLMTLGGMVMGPVVQKYAFGEYWTGWPWGTDLTDNKTAVAWIAWILAVAAQWRGWRRPAVWVAVAAVVTLLIYLIPHSLFGSELKYE